LDYFIKHKLKIKHYLRYCDDFVIISRNNKYLKSIIPIIDNFLKRRLKLHLHPDKIVIKKYNQGVDFLGYVSFPYHRILRIKTRKRMFKKIKCKMEKESFNQTVQSYLGILKHCNSYKLEMEIYNILYE